MNRYRRRAEFRLGSAVILGLLACLSGACVAPAWRHDPVLAARLDSILNRHSETGATVSARVIKLASGRELYARNIDEPVMPASNMKLPISAAGLDALGIEHNFKTHLAFDGQDLWLIGTGDPAVGDGRIAGSRGRTTTSVLDDWVSALRSRGITRIPGDLCYYDGALEAQQVHRTWEHDDLVHWYAAPVSGLNFNDNCVDITVYPTEAGQSAGVDVVPPVENIVVLNKCMSGKATTPSIARMPYADVYILGGGCVERKALKSKPVIDPGAFFAEALRTHLAANGIVIEGKVRAATSPLGDTIPPAGEHLVATHESTMPDVLWRINKTSQNLFAECLCKLTGQAYQIERGRRGPGSWITGERAIRAFLSRNGINHRRFVLADGSGLSRVNRVTGRLISDLLAVMFDHPDGEAFRASLAEPGEIGTLRSRMKELKGSLYAKTGYIRGVRALSGYVQTHDGRWLCFSIIYNNISGSTKPFSDLQDEACRLLVNWPHLDEPS
ncbi:MAG: D-alanyl-D-alanine carboxypeptidase/D-alanyl-D-alanine-endopeptidase [bacterium]|nr:D-alanyl-D-alanine carboxypeptidase/D-alanyl-D-alanine-endopeptidase [bacterium]